MLPVSLCSFGSFYLCTYCHTGYERLTQDVLCLGLRTLEHVWWSLEPSKKCFLPHGNSTLCCAYWSLEPSKKCFSPHGHSTLCCASWSPGVLEEVLLAIWPLNVALCLLVPWSPRRTILMTCCESYHCLHLLLLSCLFVWMYEQEPCKPEFKNSRIQECMCVKTPPGLHVV